MNSDDLERLYEYERPFTGRCDRCDGPETTLFYETPGGERLCNDCATPIFDSFRELGIGPAAIEPLENEPDRSGSEGSRTHLRDLLTPAVPVQYRGRVDPTVVEFAYDRIDWAAVEPSDTVGDVETVAWGGGPGTCDEVPAAGFEAVRAHFDSTLAEPNVVYLTDEGPSVFEFVAAEASERDLATEVLRVLADRSRAGVVEGLRPVEAVGPPPERLAEHLECHEDVRAFELAEDGGRSVCRVVPRGDRTVDASDVRTIDGVRYPKPDAVEIVDDLR